MGTLYVKQGGSMVEQGGGGGTGGDSGSGNESAVVTGTSGGGIVVTGSGTAHTKGSWTQLVASTAFDAETVIVTVRDTFVASNDSSTLIDIGIGASSSETVLIPNIMAGFRRDGDSWSFNIAVPAGSRISARLQSIQTTKNVTMSVTLLESGSAVAAGTAVTAMGVNTATSNGVALTVPGATNTKGAWTEIVSSTAADFTKLTVAIGMIGNNMTASQHLIDIAVGAASSEVVLINNIAIVGSNTENVVVWGLASRWFHVSIPAGSRISARYQGSTTASASSPTVALYGMD